MIEIDKKTASVTRPLSFGSPLSVKWSSHSRPLGPAVLPCSPPLFKNNVKACPCTAADNQGHHGPTLAKCDQTGLRHGRLIRTSTRPFAQWAAATWHPDPGHVVTSISVCERLTQTASPSHLASSLPYTRRKRTRALTLHRQPSLLQSKNTSCPTLPVAPSHAVRHDGHPPLQNNHSASRTAKSIPASLGASSSDGRHNACKPCL